MNSLPANIYTRKLPRDEQVIKKFYKNIQIAEDKAVIFSIYEMFIIGTSIFILPDSNQFPDMTF